MIEGHEYDSIFKLGCHNYGDLFNRSNYKVLWISPIYNHLIYFIDKNKFFHKKAINSKKFINIKENIYTYAPYSLVLYGDYPLFKNEIFGKLTVKLILPNIKKILKDNNFWETDILWIGNPKFYYLKDVIKYKKLIYRCADDFSKFEHIPKSIVNLENKLIKDADEVFVTAYDLLEKKRHLRKDLKYLPNGVNLDNFIRDQYYIPQEYRDNNKLKCIYVGAIDTWFDYRLLGYCAKELTNVQFYLIGPVKIDLSNIKELKNVSILGKKDYKEIPNYLKFSDVAIIPFLVNELTDSVNPIKLYEYMSVGLNVVSTNFKEMEYIDSPAYVAKDHKEFCNYIRQAIESKDKNRDRNIEFSKKNTWEKRFKQIKEYI